MCLDIVKKEYQVPLDVTITGYKIVGVVHEQEARWRGYRVVRVKVRKIVAEGTQYSQTVLVAREIWFPKNAFRQRWRER